MKRGREEKEFDDGDIECFFYACDTGEMSTVQDFIEREIDVNAVVARDMFKFTALHSAAANGRIDVVKVLIQNGADVHAGN